MNTAYDSQSLQSYGLRLQTEARRPQVRSSRSGLAPRLRALVQRRAR